MLNKAIKSYYKLLDEKLDNGSSVVLIIAFLIFFVGFFSPNSNLVYAKTSVLDYNNTIEESSFVVIEGKKYKLVKVSLEKKL